MKLSILIFTLGWTHVISTTCPNVTSWVENGDMCLHVDNRNASWRVSDTSCNLSGGRLARISNITEQSTWLNSSAQYWIGGFVAALVYPTYFDRCITGHARGNDVCYHIVTKPMKWYDASSYCDESGGRLVQVKDEANSRYIANALTETLNRSSAAVKYWIDGKRSDEFSENFLDRQGNLVNYTNFDPSQKVKDLQGELCIEVSLATSQPSTGSGSNSPDNFGYDPYYHEAGPPLFNMKPCTASRMFLCEYDLKPSETPLDDAGSNKTYSPSHVGSCDDIIMLSALSKSILSSTSGENSNLWTEKEKSLLSQFTGIVSGHYITAPYKDNHNPSAPGLTYELKYCNIQETKSKLNIPSYTPQQKLRLFLALYRWSELEGVHSDGIQTLLHDNQFNLNGNFTFNGSCVFLYRDHWYTGPCCEPRYSMCEYPPEVAKEIANEQTKTKEKIKTISDDLKDVTSSLNGADISFSSESFETALGVLQSIVEITEEHREEVLEDTSLETLKDMMTDVLSLVDTLNNEDIMSDLESFQTSEMDNNVNFFVTIQAITSLSDIIADSVTQELVGNTVTKISYQTNSSEVHILSSKELELLETNQQMVYSPNTIAPGSEIIISLPSHIREKANQKKVSIIYAAYSPDLYQTMDTMTVKMTPTMKTNKSIASDGNTSTLVNTAWKMATPIITATLRMEGESFSVPITYKLHKLTNSFDELPVLESEMCSFLSHYDDISIWSDIGCSVMPSEENFYICSCNHTTDFAVLLLVYNTNIDIYGHHKWVIFWLSMIGETMTICCLIAAIVTYAQLVSYLKSDRPAVHINLMVSLLVSHVCLLTSQLATITSGLSGTTESSCACSALTYFLHTSLLSSMAWMFVEGIILYRKILIVLTREPQIISKRYYIIGWGVPCLISTLTLIGRTTQNLTYHNERCWLTLQDGIIWTFAGPVCFVIAFNFTILVRVLIVAAATQQRRFLRQQNRYKPTNSNQIQQNIRTVARGIFFLTPLLGLSWVLGFFAATSVVLSYVFVFTNAFQGVYLLLFYVILNPEVKCALLERKRARQRSFLAISGLGSVRTSTQNTWKQRLSFTFLNKLSLSPSTSENTSPVSNELNTQNPKEVQNFNEENLSSRPCSGRSNLNFIISPALRNRGKITPTPERWSVNLKGETNEAFMGDLGNDEYIMSRQTSGIELKKTEDQDDDDLFGNISDDGGSSLEKLEDTDEYEQELSNEREHVKEEISHPDSESCGYADLTETTEKLEIAQTFKETPELKQQEHKQRIKVKQRRKSAPGELVCRSRACHVCKPHRLQHKRKKKKKTEIRAAWPEQASSNNDHCDVMTKMPVLLQNNRPQSTQSRDSGIGI